MNSKDTTSRDGIIAELIDRYPALEACRTDILEASERIVRCYTHGGTVLVCGNGGSSADSAHIVGELMKGFMKRRAISGSLASALRDTDGEAGRYLEGVLQQALPAIDLTAQSALMTAFSNDQASDAVFAQQILGYSRKENLLIALSTSGNSRNVVYAAMVARTLGMATVGMTGASGGALSRYCDVTIAVPEKVTPKVQELHLPVYHALCIIVEAHFFDS